MEPIFNKDQMKNQFQKQLLRVEPQIKIKLNGQLLQLKDPGFEKVRNELRYRLNKLYTHPLLGDLLDSGDIDYAILDVLETLGKRKNLQILCHSEYIMKEFVHYPIIKALFDLNILYKQKYYHMIVAEHALYQEIIQDYVQEKLSKMTRAEHIRFWMYLNQKAANLIQNRKVNGVRFGSTYSGVPYAKKKLISNKPKLKQSRTFDPYELYFDDVHPNQVIDATLG